MSKHRLTKNLAGKKCTGDEYSKFDISVGHKNQMALSE